MTSNYVIVPIKLHLDVGNDEHIILCNFGDRFVSSFEVMEGDPKAQEGSPVWIEIKFLGSLSFNVKHLF